MDVGKDVNKKAMRPDYMRHFLLGIDITVGLLLWSIEQYLPEAIFAFPLFSMAISGYEIFAFVPVVLVIFCYNRLLQVNAAVMLAIASLSCAAAARSNPIWRLPFLALAETATFFVIANRVFNKSSYVRRRSCVGLLIALILILVLRFEFRSVNAIWIHLRYNNILCVVGLLSAFLLGYDLKQQQQKEQQQSLHGHNTNPSANTSNNNNNSSSSSMRSGGHTSTLVTEPKIRSLWLRAACALGSELFILMCLATSPGVLARWVELDPWPASIFVILAVAAGAITSVTHPDLCTLFPVWAVSNLLACLLLLYSSTPVIAFAGGLVLIWSTCALLPTAFTRVSRCPPSKTLAVALLIRMMLCFVNVWVVAYKFVPAGFLLRERLDVNMLFPVACIGFGLVRRRKLETAGATSRAETQFRRHIVTAVIVLTLVTLLPVAIQRASHRYIAKSTSGEGNLRGMIWTIHFGYDNNGRNNFDLLNAEVAKYQPDVFGFLETDTTRIFTGNADPVEYVSDIMGYHSYYGPSTRMNTWGCAFYSLYPITTANPVVLPSPEGELACLIDATIDVNGTDVRVFVTHFGNKEDELDRRLQTETVAKMAADHARDKPDVPLIFLGYFTMEPEKENYNLIKDSGMRDTAPNILTRWCEYIWFRGLELHGFHRIPELMASDTEIQLADFRFPPKNPSSS